MGAEGKRAGRESPEGNCRKGTACVPHALDIFMLAGAAALGVLLVLALRWRRQSYSVHATQLAGEEVCDHLRPALDLLTSRGHRVVRVGQSHPDLPLEIHLAPPPDSPPFNPKGVYDELKLAEPVFVSERNVLYCKEDWCEIHPKKG